MAVRVRWRDFGYTGRLVVLAIPGFSFVPTRRARIAVRTPQRDLAHWPDQGWLEEIY
jgi:hypothetical protein